MNNEKDEIPVFQVSLWHDTTQSSGGGMAEAFIKPIEFRK